LRRGARAIDPADEIAVVASARRELLLRVNRHRLRRDDLEDCFAQATLELVARARSGGAFASRAHIANALQLRFLSRVRDRRRALGGRSPIAAALEQAVSIRNETGDGAGQPVEIVDASATVELQVMRRAELRDICAAAQQLTLDQRLVLGSQIAQVSCSAFCARFGWSREKYRKVAQRARQRLRQLVAAEAVAVPRAAPVSEEHAGPTYEEARSHT
jgi:hypothetical protein